MAMRDVELTADAWTDIGLTTGEVAAVQNIGRGPVYVYEGATSPDGVAGWLLSPGDSVVISVGDPVLALSQAQTGRVTVATTVQV